MKPHVALGRAGADLISFEVLSDCQENCPPESCCELSPTIFTEGCRSRGNSVISLARIVFGSVRTRFGGGMA